MQYIPDASDLKILFPEYGEIEFIADGSFKAAYRVTSAEGTEALKVILVPDDDGSGWREQFLARVEREIAILSKASTPFLVKLGSVAPRSETINGRDYLIYSEEFLPGPSVQETIKNEGPQEFDEVVSLAQCLMSAVAEIAELGHIHRDIKPANIVRTGIESRPYVLLDLGVAFKVDGTELTQPGGGAPGTALYMAPEMFKPDYKDVLDIRSDIYSAGLTIFEFATGKHPMTRTAERGYYATLYRLMNPTPRHLADLRGDFPTDFCDMIDRCNKRTPALRYRDPSTFLEDLEQFL
jgi:serine/threonine protein kinase